MIAILTALFLFISSYLEVNDNLTEFVKKYRVEPSQFDDTQTWVTILLLSLLASAIIFGVLIIFIYYQKMIGLYRLQSNFINGFTHELKTPIASLRLYLDTFNKYELNKEEQEKYIRYMIKDTDRLHKNVNQILNLSKIEDGSIATEFENIDMVEFIDQFFKKNTHYFEDIDIEIDSKVSKHFRYKIDVRLFEMVLMNIVTNAINYGQRELKNHMQINFEETPFYYLIKFKDNGIGIAKHELKKVFKKMYQVGKSTKGSGLGLYLVLSILKMHKVDVYAESAGTNRGTTIIMKFPKMRTVHE